MTNILRNLVQLVLLMPLYAAAQLSYPSAHICSQMDNYFGYQVADPYRWMECADSSDTQQWVAAENKLTESWLDSIPYRQALRNRIAAACRYHHYTPPYHHGGYEYYYTLSGQDDQWKLYRRHSGGSPELVLDVNTLSIDHSVRVNGLAHSADDHYAAFLLSHAGSDWSTIRVMDLYTLKILPDSIPWVKFSEPAWEGDGFYYGAFPAPLPGKELTATNSNQKIYYHKIDSTHDIVAYDNKDTTLMYQVSVSPDERYVFIAMNDPSIAGGNAMYYRRHGTSEFRPIERHLNKGGNEYIWSDSLAAIILTGARSNNGQVTIRDFASDIDRVLIAEDDKAVITDVKVAGGKIFVTYDRDVADHVKVYDMQGKFENEIALPGLGSVYGFEGAMDDTVVYYSYTSFIQPATVYAYHIASRSSTIYHASESSFDPTLYQVQQVFYRGFDLVKVPMFIVSKKGLSEHEPHPLVLTAYGGFGQIIASHFDPMLVPFLEQGGVYAVAGIRGGGEYGGAWHMSGMQSVKITSFNDFIYAAQYLIKHKYTDAEHLAIKGASNGGLIVTGSANMRPDLFHVVVAEMPVTDMIRFPVFTIGAAWVSEYGSPAVASDFSYLYTYSPLHHIQPKAKYPAMLVVTADHDDRVVPAHSYKYVATLQAVAGPNTTNPLLMQVLANSGHGANTLQQAMTTEADIYSFIFRNLGITPKF